MEEFRWEERHQAAFDKIKEYPSKPLVLMPPIQGHQLELYLSTASELVGYLLAQNNSKGHEQAVYYLSKVLNPIVTRYSSIENLFLVLYFACTKLRHYLIKSQVYVVSQTDLMKYMLNRPLITGRIGIWSLALLEFTLVYFPHKSIKGQTLINFLVDHHSLEIGTEKSVELGIYGAEKEPWILKFDGSSIENSTGAGIVIISPREVKTTLSFNLAFECTNNQAEYEALVIVLEILLELGVKDVLVIRDSQLVLRQLTREYKCNNLLLTPYFTIQLLDSFDNEEFEHVPTESNW